MLTIDGSFGEGGGQIVRSSLALAMVTQTPIQISNVRAGRKKPGLKRQHVAAARAAAAVSGGELEGDEVGSSALSFIPGPIMAGHYHFSVGSAGSTTLVLQTVLPALLVADGQSTVTLEGGTHNPFAPPFDFLVRSYLPIVNRMGPTVTATLDQHGFFPAGGGRFTLTIDPLAFNSLTTDSLMTETLPAESGQAESAPVHAKLIPIDLMDRGPLKEKKALSLVARLPEHIAERELGVVKRKLGWRERELFLHEVKQSLGPGNVLMIALEYEHVTAVFTAFGQRGRSAELVAKDAVRQCQQYLDSDAPLDEYLTDQVLLPLAIAGGGSFRSTGLSLHATTHIELLQKFLPVSIKADTDDVKQGTVAKIRRL